MNLKLVFFFCLLSFISISQATSWKLIPNQSSLTFVATQNGAPVSGNFKKFDGTINFDPNQLDKSDIEIIIDMASVSDAYNQISDTLKSTPWFDVKVFPNATFKANKITKTGERTYQAQGKLTIRDKTIPVTLNFKQEEYSPIKARMKGSTTIKRTDFGVGQGDWADTKTVKDDVKILFTVTATNK